jgi:hypothetical protein
LTESREPHFAEGPWGVYPAACSFLLGGRVILQSRFTRLIYRVGLQGRFTRSVYRVGSQSRFAESVYRVSLQGWFTESVCREFGLQRVLRGLLHVCGTFYRVRVYSGFTESLQRVYREFTEFAESLQRVCRTFTESLLRVCVDRLRPPLRRRHG